MKFGYTTLYVPSVPSTLKFYAAAFNLPTRFVLPSGDYGELSLPGPASSSSSSSSTTLGFANETFAQQSIGPNAFRPNRKDDPAAAGVAISLVTEAGEDVREVFARAVEAGAEVVAEPKEKPWGQVAGYVRDCNGFLVEVCEPVREG